MKILDKVICTDRFAVGVALWISGVLVIWVVLGPIPAICIILCFLGHSLMGKK